MARMNRQHILRKFKNIKHLGTLCQLNRFGNYTSTRPNWIRAYMEVVVDGFLIGRTLNDRTDQWVYHNNNSLNISYM